MSEHAIERFEALGRKLKTAAKTIAGNAASLLDFDGVAKERLGFLVHNHSSTLKLFLKLSKLDTGESVASNDKHFVIPPEATALIRANVGVRCWAMNSSAAATTSEIDAVEIM